MNVLIACEESQRVCKEFRRMGHNAFSCDVLDCSGGYPEWHILQDVVPLINGNCEFATMDGRKHKINKKWDLIIAFPPCTFITNAAARHLWKNHELNKARYVKGLPKLNPTQIVEPTATWGPSGSYSHKHGEKHKGVFTKNRARQRSKTFEGVAAAMAEQWGSVSV